MSPIPAVVIGAIAVTAVTDAVSNAQDISNGPLYGMLGVLGAALIVAVGNILVSRRRLQPETPDVAQRLDRLDDKLTRITADVAAVKATQQAAFDKIDANRHEQRNVNTDLFGRLELIDRHLRPWRDDRDAQT